MGADDIVGVDLLQHTHALDNVIFRCRGEVKAADDRVSAILEDRVGNLWFATQGGVSRFDGATWRTLTTADGKKVEVGMTPFQGQPLMYLPDISPKQVETEVNEMDVEKIKIGQPVQVMLDAVRDVVFRGRVSKVGTLAEQKVSKVSGRKTGVKVFSVVVDVLDADPRLRPGLSATAAILIDEFKDVAYVPVEAIFNESGKTVAYVKHGRKARQITVDCGTSNDKYVIIRGGLQPGDKVFLGQPS